MKYTLTQCKDDLTWDAFVRGSPQGSVFCTSSVIGALGVRSERWLVAEEGRPVASAVVLLDAAGHPLRSPFSFTMYQGILLSGELAAQEPHTRVPRSLAAVAFLLEELERRHDSLSFCLHHRFEDCRPLSWFHYDQPELGLFQIALQYTAILDMAAWPCFEEYVDSIRGVRRYENRRWRNQGMTTRTATDLDELDRIHNLTFERQGISREAGQVSVLRSVAQAALRGGLGELVSCTAPDGRTASVALFLHDDRTGYYWVAANDPAYRNTGAGTVLLLECIRRCMEEKRLRWFDFVGINSPNRGDFKVGFNAIPAPYHVATWRRPQAPCDEKSI